MTKKENEKKEKVKKTTKSSSKKESLIDLVNESEVPFFRMMMDLSRTGLDKQLEEEIRLTTLGKPIKKTMTKTEFNKILGVVD
jgi:hypothetical protein